MPHSRRHVLNWIHNLCYPLVLDQRMPPTKGQYSHTNRFLIVTRHLREFINSIFILISLNCAFRSYLWEFHSFPCTQKITQNHTHNVNGYSIMGNDVHKVGRVEQCLYSEILKLKIERSLSRTLIKLPFCHLRCTKIDIVWYLFNFGYYVASRCCDRSDSQ